LEMRRGIGHAHNPVRFVKLRAVSSQDHIP